MSTAPHPMTRPFPCRVANCKVPGFDEEDTRNMHEEMQHPHEVKRRQKSQTLTLGRSTNLSAVQLAAQGVTTPEEYLTFMSALMRDIAEKKIDLKQAQAICQVSKEMLKMLELVMRFKK